MSATETAPDEHVSRASRRDRSRRDAHAKPLKSAKTPVGLGAVTFVGALLALGLIGLGVVGLQTAVSAAGVTQVEPWLTTAVEGLDGLRPAAWMAPVGLLLAALGLWLLLVAVRPRPKTAVPLAASTGVFVRPRDLAQLAQNAAGDVDGVAAVRARATGTRITLIVDSTGGPGVRDAVKEAVGRRLAAVKKTPRVSVKVKEKTP